MFDELVSAVVAVFETLNPWVIPAAILLIVVWGAVRRVPLYESFVTGAKEGFEVAITIIPYLVAILFVIKVFTASGIFADVKQLAAAACGPLGLDASVAEGLDLFPLAFTRPLSGSGARGVMLEIFDVHGPDSFLGNVASLMMGGTETTFYVLTVYYGCIQIKKIRHTLPACLIADAAAMVAAIVVGLLLFR